MFLESDCQHTEVARSVMPDLQLGALFQTFWKTVHFLCLLLDITWNIFTSQITSTSSAFEIILQLTRYINYLLTYLLTSVPYRTVIRITRFVLIDDNPDIVIGCCVRNAMRRNLNGGQLWHSGIRVQHVNDSTSTRLLQILRCIRLQWTEEDAVGQRYDVAQKLQKGRPSYPCHWTERGLRGRRVESVVFDFQTEVSPEGWGLRRWPENLRGELWYFLCRCMIG